MSVILAVCSWLALFQTIVLASDPVRVDVYEAPYIDDGHDVQFFILEASFPYNTPDDIRDMAGDIFQKYYITHAGLGVWDTTSDVKFSIEFVSDKYVGALLPEFNDEDETLVWKNGGKVVFTTPTQATDWLNSQLVCVTTGVAYNQLITFIEDNMDIYTKYQPVEVVWYNESLSSAFNSSDYTSNDLIFSGDLKVAKTESFWFVNTLINQLSTYGATVEAYLTVYATSFQYLSLNDVAPAVVSWESDQPANADVFRWYKGLSACYDAEFAKAQDSQLGGQYFLDLLKGCYGDYAYVFLSDTSVYNVTLSNYSRSDSSPKLTRYVFDLLADGTGSAEELQPIDYVLITLVFLGITVGTYYILRRVCSTPTRRKVSMDGEMVAERTVDKLAGSNGDGSTADGNDVQQNYYRTKSTEGGVVMSLIAAVSRGSPALGLGQAQGQAQGQTSSSLKGSGGSDPDFSRATNAANAAAAAGGGGSSKFSLGGMFSGSRKETPTNTEGSELVGAAKGGSDQI